MAKVELSAELAAKVRDTLRGQQDQIKTAQDEARNAMEKVAAVQQENDVLKGMLQLVSDGYFDPSEAIEKLSGFLSDPTSFEFHKSAHELGIDRVDTQLGVPVKDSGPAAPASNPIERCLVGLMDDGIIG